MFKNTITGSFAYTNTRSPVPCCALFDWTVQVECNDLDSDGCAIDVGKVHGEVQMYQGTVLAFSPEHLCRKIYDKIVTLGGGRLTAVSVTLDPQGGSWSANYSRDVVGDAWSISYTRGKHAPPRVGCATNAPSDDPRDGVLLPDGMPIL